MTRRKRKVDSGNRLLLVAPSVNGAFGEQIELLVGHLRNTRLRVFLTVPTHYHESRPRYVDDWVFKTKGNKFATAIRLLSPLTLWAVARHLLRVMPDCVYIYCGEVYPPAILVMLLSKLLRIKCILSIHDVVPHPGKLYDMGYNLLRTPFLNLPTILHTFSEHGWSILRRKYPRKHVIHSPLLDLAESYLHHARTQISSKNVILCFGRIEPYKDIPLVVQAFKGLRQEHPDAKLRIVGKNGLGNELFCITQDIYNCEVIAKFLNPVDLAQELVEAQVCIFAYTEGSHSGGAELALAFGCNVVATNVAAFNGMAGVPGVFLFETGDTVECAKALSRALSARKRPVEPTALQRVAALNRDRMRLFLNRANIGENSQVF